MPPTSRPPWQTMGYQIQPRDIMLIRTGRDAFYGQPDYVFRGPAITAGATHWLYVIAGCA